MTSVIWLRQDLRVHDHAGWRLVADSGEPVLAMFVLPEQHLAPGPAGFDRIGAARAAFLADTLVALRTTLAEAGIPFLSVIADPVVLFADWAARTPIKLFTASGQAWEEKQWLSTLQDAGVPLRTYESQTLLSALPPSLAQQDAFPHSFSRFRRDLERANATPDAPAGAALPSLGAQPPGWLAQLPDALDWLLQRARRCNISPPRGGEPVALNALQRFMQDHAHHYADTRAGLSGPGFSSGLSGHLSTGALSVRQAWQASLAQEAEGSAMGRHGKAFRSELLWREFFHWSARVHGAALFRHEGLYQRISQRPPVMTPARRLYWTRLCQARTGLPIIDACLRELFTTGWLSNRGRQWLASFLCHELQLDWRWGAELFQHYLIDDDVASNWGNWAYVAGAGHDRRGGRHFDLLAQSAHHDPRQAHIRHWVPELAGLEPQDIVHWHRPWLPRAHTKYPEPMIAPLSAPGTAA